MTQPKTSTQRYHRGFFTPLKNPTIICGSITQTGVVGVSPAAAIREGSGFTVAYTGVGTYTISTVDTHFANLICATASVEAAGAGVDMYANITGITTGTGAATAVEFSTLTANVVTEIPRYDDLHFTLVLVSAGVDA